jgi:hypothetical protein
MKLQLLHRHTHDDFYIIMPQIYTTGFNVYTRFYINTKQFYNSYLKGSSTDFSVIARLKKL